MSPRHSKSSGHRPNEYISLEDACIENDLNSYENLAWLNGSLYKYKSSPNNTAKIVVNELIPIEAHAPHRTPEACFNQGNILLPFKKREYYRT
jgi:hypothetical protein